MVLMDALLTLNQRLPQEERKEFVVAHFNHRLREESYLDLKLIKKYLKSFSGIYFYSSWKEPAKSNVEASAREARYQFLADVVEATESDSIMTAHHLNDATETMIMRLIRGTSIKGINGIDDNYERFIETSKHRAIFVRIMRPLLNVTKNEIYAYAQENHVPFIEDQSNYQDYYLRNRIRHTILPLLEEENPQFMRNIMSLSDQLTASYRAHYHQYLQEETKFAALYEENSWLLYVPELLKFSKEQLQVYLLIFFEERLIHYIPNYNKAILKQIEYMITQTSAPNMVIDIGNHWQAHRSYDFIQIQLVTEESTQTEALDEIVVSRKNQWYTLNKEERVGIFDQEVFRKMDLDFKRVQMITLPTGEFDFFNFRHRLPGDLVHLQRSSGEDYHKKISRILIDQKIPSQNRDNFWIVEDQEGTVLAMLPHITKDEPYIPRSVTQPLILLYENISN